MKRAEWSPKRPKMLTIFALVRQTVDAFVDVSISDAQMCRTVEGTSHFYPEI